MSDDNDGLTLKDCHGESAENDALGLDASECRETKGRPEEETDGHNNIYEPINIIGDWAPEIIASSTYSYGTRIYREILAHAPPSRRSVRSLRRNYNQ